MRRQPLLLFVAMIVLAACGNSASDSSTTTTTAVGAGASTTVATPASVDQSTLPVVKSATWFLPMNDHDDKFKIDIQGVFRNGPFASLYGNITCLAESKGSCDTITRFSAGISSWQTAAGITLVDPNGKKQYLAVSNSERKPYASLIGTSIGNGRSISFFVNYPALPEGVTAINVVLPTEGAPQITDVPVK